VAEKASAGAEPMAHHPRPRRGPRRPLVLLVNPGSGGKPGSPGADQEPWSGDPGELAVRLERRGLEVELVVMSESDDPRGLASRAAAEGRDFVAAGGDGTVRPAAEGLLDTGATLGILPLGSFNNIARGAGIPLELDGAMDRIVAGARRRIDAGVAWRLPRLPDPGAPPPEPPDDAVWFFEAAGAGIDAEGFGAARIIERKGWVFAMGAAWRALRRRGTPVLLIVDGHERRMASPAVTVCNGPYYGFGMSLAPDADPGDGILDVVAFSHMSRLAVLRHFVRSARERPPAEPRVWVHPARTVIIDGERRRLPAHADGRAIGPTPIAVTVRPGALSVFS